MNKPYMVRALVTVSIHAQMYADSEEEALEKAADLCMPHIHENTTYRREGVSDDHWNTSGELDGEAFDYYAIKLDEPID
jgi:hypothetical protein